MVKQRTTNSEISGLNPTCSIFQILLKFFASVFMGSRQNGVVGLEFIHGSIGNKTTVAQQQNFLGLFSIPFLHNLERKRECVCL